MPAFGAMLSPVWAALSETEAEILKGEDADGGVTGSRVAAERIRKRDRELVWRHRAMKARDGTRDAR